MSKRIGRAATFALLTMLAGCDVENVQWAFVSNPGGSFGTTGGAVIVIRFTSTSGVVLDGDFVSAQGFDERGAVTVLLPWHGDFAVLARTGAVEVRSPALSFAEGTDTRPGRVELTNAFVQVPPPGGPAALRVQTSDASRIHPSAVGAGTLHIARAGTLMILESGSGLVVFGEHESPEVVGTSATLTTTLMGNTFALLLPNQTQRILIAPPLPLPEQRLAYVPEHDSLRILGPVAEALAELPDEVVILQGGAGGLFLQAALPEGLPGDPVPMTLTMAAHNRYLLRVNP